jgi:hypothetical protein
MVLETKAFSKRQKVLTHLLPLAGRPEWNKASDPCLAAKQAALQSGKALQALTSECRQATELKNQGRQQN